MKRHNPYHKDFFETKAWSNKKLVCGVDEVGRGCFAGPLVVAAALLPASTTYELTDSKKLSSSQRDTAFAWLIQNCQYAIAYADPYCIERYNIYQATLRTMRRACLLLAASHAHPFSQVETIVVDAMPLTLPPLEHNPDIVFFPKGEDFSRSVAAASILAKVTRDRLMERTSHLFPRFNFAQNKAYGSAHHRMTLQAHHATLIHRPSFIKNFTHPQPDTSHEQYTIFHP